MGQKFTSTSSIAFKLSTLGQSFQVAFQKIFTSSGWDFGPFLLTELVYLSQVCRPPCSHTHFFPCFAHKFPIGLKSGLCDCHSNALSLLSLNHFIVTLEVSFGSSSIWNSYLRPSFNFLADVLRRCFNASIIVLKMPYILWTAPVPPAAKHPHNMMLPPLCFRDGMVFFGSKAFFSSKHNNGYYGQTVPFLFCQIRGHVSKK